MFSEGQGPQRHGGPSWGVKDDSVYDGVPSLFGVSIFRGTPVGSRKRHELRVDPDYGIKGWRLSFLCDRYVRPDRPGSYLFPVDLHSVP